MPKQVRRPVRHYRSKPGNYYLSYQFGTPVVFSRSANGRLEILAELHDRRLDRFYDKLSKSFVWEEPTAKIDGILFVHDCWSPLNYCHWLVDWMPRFEVALRGGLNPADVKIALPGSYGGFQQQMLQKLGIRDENVPVLPRNAAFATSTVAVKKFFASSLQGQDFVHSFHGGQRWASTFLRSVFPPSHPSASPVRVLVGRKGSGRQLLISDKAQILLRK